MAQMNTAVPPMKLGMQHPVQNKPKRFSNNREEKQQQKQREICCCQKTQMIDNGDKISMDPR